MALNYRVEVANVFATFNVGKTLNITYILDQLLPLENRTGGLNYFSVRIRSESTLVRFFDSGKAIVYEARSLENARNGSRKAAQVLQNLVGSGYHNYRVISIIGKAKLSREINIGHLTRLNTESEIYMQMDDRYTAKCDFPCFGTVIRVHKTGTLTIIGKNLTKMELALSDLEKQGKEVWHTQK